MIDEYDELALKILRQAKEDRDNTLYGAVMARYEGLTSRYADAQELAAEVIAYCVDARLRCAECKGRLETTGKTITVELNRLKLPITLNHYETTAILRIFKCCICGETNFIVANEFVR